jgi:N6-adenosine-specific RNA methylase IME4
MTLGVGRTGTPPHGVAGPGKQFEKPFPYPFRQTNASRRGYGAILADPPWRFRTWSTKGDGRAPPYARMSLAEILALPVAELAAPDCALFLWAIDPMLPEALEVIAAWGFTYKTVAFTWVKTSGAGGYPIGCGYWTRANPETCLLATRGRPKRVARDVRQLIISPRREHSRKPDEVRRRIERLVAGPYLELFARERAPGWDAWGAMSSACSTLPMISPEILVAMPRNIPPPSPMGFAVPINI